MDTNNRRLIQPVVDPAMEGADWRSTLQPESRQRIVTKIMETLKRHLPFYGEKGLQELKKIAERFEEKIYSAAFSQSDYLRKISLKMLTMETKSQNGLSNPMRCSGPGYNNTPLDPVEWLSDLLDSSFPSNSAGNNNCPTNPVLFRSVDHCTSRTNRSRISQIKVMCPGSFCGTNMNSIHKYNNTC